MLKYNNLKIRVDFNQDIQKVLQKKLKDKSISNIKILKKNIDARNKNEIFFVYQVAFESKNEYKLLKNKNIDKYTKPKFNQLKKGSEKLSLPIVIVGFGPAGIFCAHTLVNYGYPVIVLERGKQVDERIADINLFNEKAILNEESNVQFGEGGAGTFSDGKLTARSKDRRVNNVYQTLVEYGAPSDIIYESYPHIGSDKLREIIPNMRNDIISKGGKILFNAKFEKLIMDQDEIVGVQLANGNIINTNVVVLSIGNSSRDTFINLHNQNVHMESKPFSVGFRVEHNQKMIDKALYHKFCDCDSLHAASYRLTHQTSNNKGVYTFCMCPGGEVVAATSLKNHLCVNGMSYYARDKENANSAVLVQVDHNDYGENLFDGLKFQEALEKKAFLLGGSNYKAPVQKVKDYLNNSKSSTFDTVKPSYPIGYSMANINELFSDTLNNSLHEALLNFENKIPGFAEYGVISAVETRTSSPIRINRDKDTLESLSHNNLYPCGEGCGYAGGIVSSAVDGIKIAEKIISKFCN